MITVIGLQELYGKEARYCSNRKEVKDHGADAGNLLGSELHDGDRVIMVEDVTTSGKSIDETYPVLKGAADVDVKGLIVSLIMRVERAFQEGRGLRGCLLRQVLRDHTAERDGAAAGVAGREVRIRHGVVSARVVAGHVQTLYHASVCAQRLALGVDVDPVHGAQQHAGVADAVERGIPHG